MKGSPFYDNMEDKMKLKLKSEPSLEFQKVSIEMDFDIKAKDPKEQEAELKKLWQNLNTLAIEYLNDLIEKKDKYQEDRAWTDPLEEKPIPAPRQQVPQATKAPPKTANIGALWLSDDGTISGNINGNKWTVPQGELAENIKAIVAPAYYETKVGVNHIRIIKNKYKTIQKHPDYIIFPVLEK
jgi:hypothetical protein